MVQEGQLRAGDILLCGEEYGRVRAMRDEKRYEIKVAGPSTPVEVLGLSGVPVAGEDAAVVKDERKAREVAAKRHQKNVNLNLLVSKKRNLKTCLRTWNQVTLANLTSYLKLTYRALWKQFLNHWLSFLLWKEKVNIVGSGVGGITEPTRPCAASGVIVLGLGFNVRADAEGAA